MSQKTLFPSSRSKTTKASPIRRRLRLVDVMPGRVFSFEIYSMTRAGYDIEHRQDADLETGTLRCTCEDFVYRHGRFVPTVGDPTHICKHLTRVLAYLTREKHLHGHEVAVQLLMKQLRPCCECGVDMADYELCDERGHVLPGFICRECVERKRDAQCRLEDMRCQTLDRYARWLRQGQRELETLNVWKPEREALREMLSQDLASLEATRQDKLRQWGMQERALV